MSPSEDVVTRFWRHVDRTGSCWEWTGARSPKGYGRFNRRERGGTHRVVVAHRFAYEITTGPIPAGAFVCHRCDNPPCVNPSHLWVGSAAENTADMLAKGRQSAPSTRRLTAAAVADARRRVRAGERLGDVGRSYGVTASTLSSAVRGLTWREVDEPPVPTRRNQFTRIPNLAGSEADQ